jgi:hypothetical protein
MSYRIAPINKLAATVLFARGERYAPVFRNGPNMDTDHVPPVRVMRDGEFSAGTRFGRLASIGQSLEFPKKIVCRCDCGNYAIRGAKELRMGSRPACDTCYAHAASRKKELARRGIFRNIEDML